MDDADFFAGGFDHTAQQSSPRTIRIQVVVSDTSPTFFFPKHRLVFALRVRRAHRRRRCRPGIHLAFGPGF